MVGDPNSMKFPDTIRRLTQKQSPPPPVLTYIRPIVYPQTLNDSAVPRGPDVVPETRLCLYSA